MKTELAHVPPDYRPVGEILSLVGDKWTVLTVVQLIHGKMRFNELRRQMNGISQKMLASTLRNLERDGFVSRTIYPVIPPRVDYELTEMGRMLLLALRHVGEFALNHRDAVEQARRQFDAHTSVEIILHEDHADDVKPVPLRGLDGRLR